MPNGLAATMPVFKFFDDVTMVECTEKAGTSYIQTEADQLATWSHHNFMNINFRKTNEICMSAIRETWLPPLIIDGIYIIRADSFKQQGITITRNLRREAHVSAIHATVCKRLHFLKLLKRSPLS
jgi:hypothetical protein